MHNIPFTVTMKTNIDVVLFIYYRVKIDIIFLINVGISCHTCSVFDQLLLDTSQLNCSSTCVVDDLI
jgi:hypothetical protein